MLSYAVFSTPQPYYLLLLMSHVLGFLLSELKEFDKILERLPVSSLTILFRLVAHLHTHLAWETKGKVPVSLPDPVLKFFASAIDVTPVVMTEVWALIREYAWSYMPETSGASADLLQIFLKHAVPHGIGIQYFNSTLI